MEEEIESYRKSNCNDELIEYKQKKSVNLNGVFIDEDYIFEALNNYKS